MTPLSAIRHSIFARLVLWAIVSAMVITSGLWLLTDATIQRADRMALERAVDVDLAGLADIHATSGREELARRIRDRLALQPREGSAVHYMLADAGGRRVAGDIARWPGLHAGIAEAREIRLSAGATAFARATQLGPDLRLLVAHEHRDLGLVLRQVALAFLTGGALAVLAVALAGRMAANRLAGRIERINAAFRAPGNDERLSPPDAGGQDEIDELTRHCADALDRLRHLAAAQRETTDHVAHEMRTPLMHLDNRLVRALAASPEEATARSIADARTEIRGIIRMLESLLDIATSEARRGDRHGLSPVDLSALASRLGELYADSAEESGHRFVIEVEPGVTIEGEEMALTRLITNLLDNAFKFVPAGGTVKLALRKGPVLTVSDDGPGVPPDQRETIFEKFNRGGRGNASEGAGLGLALCRAIAQRHLLRMDLAPTDRGACFVVTPETKR